jgi:hypothetical protein
VEQTKEWYCEWHGFQYKRQMTEYYNLFFKKIIYINGPRLNQLELVLPPVTWMEFGIDNTTHPKMISRKLEEEIYKIGIDLDLFPTTILLYIFRLLLNYFELVSFFLFLTEACIFYSLLKFALGNSLRVAAFFYGHGVPLGIANRVYYICNNKGHHLLPYVMGRYYATWVTHVDDLHHAHYYNVKKEESCGSTGIIITSSKLSIKVTVSYPISIVGQ